MNDQRNILTFRKRHCIHRDGKCVPLRTFEPPIPPQHHIRTFLYRRQHETVTHSMASTHVDPRSNALPILLREHSQLIHHIVIRTFHHWICIPRHAMAPSIYSFRSPQRCTAFLLVPLHHIESGCRFAHHLKFFLVFKKKMLSVKRINRICQWNWDFELTPNRMENGAYKYNTMYPRYHHTVIYILSSTKDTFGRFDFMQ